MNKDYKEKLLEALDADTTPSAVRGWIRITFPELMYEETVKGLEQQIKYHLDSAEEEIRYTREECHEEPSDLELSEVVFWRRCLAWVKKQGELFKWGPGHYYWDGENTHCISTVCHEDERIRKALIKQFSQQRAEMTFGDTGLTFSEILAWLEKQKELPFVKDVMLGYPGIYFYDGERMHFQGNPAMEEKQKEQKDFPITDEEVKKLLGNTPPVEVPEKYKTPDWLFEKQKEQKPAEWSNTNELVFGDICKHLKEEGYNGWIVLLEALRNGEFQSKQEWSEENERMIDTIVSVLGQYIDYKAVSGTGSGYATPRYNKEIDWLKSLRPSWKPSEEQMEALNAINCYGDLSYIGQQSQLISLYNDLKKLK